MDELITKLSLDTSQFDEGEQRLVASLRRMENAAQRGGRQVTSAVGRNTVDFFRMIESPISGLRRQFEMMATWVDRPREGLRQLSDQGRRTGEDVERNIGRATVAMRGLGIAGLAAFAAYEALNKTFQAVSGVAGRVVTAGIGAGAANMGINEFRAISQALFATPASVPLEETQNWLANYREMQNLAQRGDPAGLQYMQQLQQGLGRTGLGQITGANPYGDRPEDFFIKLARGLATMPEDQAFAAGRGLGLSRQMVAGLRAEGARLPADIAEQRRVAPTPAQQSQAERYIAAMNRLSEAWDRVLRSVMLSGLADGLTRFANWLNRLFGGPAPSGTAPSGTLQEIIPRLETGTLADPDAAVSSAGAIGRNQIMPATARQYGFDPARLHEREYNDQVRDAILADLTQRYGGNANDILVAYNAGPGVADRWIAGGRRMEDLPRETQGYLARAAGMGQGIAGGGEGTGGYDFVGTREFSRLGEILGIRGSDFLGKDPVGTSGFDRLGGVLNRSIQRSQAAGGVVNRASRNVVNVGGITINGAGRNAKEIAEETVNRLQQLTPLAVPSGSGME